MKKMTKIVMVLMMICAMAYAYSEPAEAASGSRISIRGIAFSLGSGYGAYDANANALYAAMVNNSGAPTMTFACESDFNAFIETFRNNVFLGYDTDLLECDYTASTSYDYDGSNYVESGFVVTYNQSVIAKAHNYYTAVCYANAAIGRIVANGWTQKKAATAIDSYIRKHSSYDRSYRRHAAIENFQGSSVCTGYACAYKLLCMAAGINCRIVTGYDKSTGGGHEWNRVKIGKTWYYNDTTWNDTSRTHTKWLLKKTFKDHRVTNGNDEDELFSY